MMIQLNRSRKLCGLVALLAFASLAAAQRRDDLPEFNGAMLGRGTAHFNGRDYTFDRMEVSIRSNQDVLVHAWVGDDNLVFTGHGGHSVGARRELDVDLDTARLNMYKADADATAHIYVLGNNGFSSVDLHGRDLSNHGYISLQFRGDRTVDMKRWDWDHNRPGDYDDNRDHDRDHDHDHDQDWLGGRFVDVERWRDEGRDREVQYRLELDADSGRSRLLIQATRPWTRPDRDKDDRRGHGDVINWISRGETVVQTGNFVHNGSDVIIHFYTLQHGDDSRDKKERMTGHLRGGVLYIDSWDKNFYGHDVKLSFERVDR